MDKIKAIVASYVGVIAYAGLVFVGAGTIRYWQGALYLLLAVLGTTLCHLLMRPGSELAVRRLREARCGQSWDQRLLGVFFVVNAMMFLVAGVDSGRFHWSGAVPLALTVAGAGLMLVGQLLFALAKRENAFFSSTVHIQMARGHRVCETGPYRWVRHPGYLGLLVALAGFPLVMGAYWAFVPAVLGAAILVMRTALEDRFLFVALPGYRAYAARTKYRLIPGVF